MSSALSRPVVSVVTPFYNTADFLAECIESTLAQTFHDFELVLADNCSTDGSTEIAQHYAALDARVRYFRNEIFLEQVPNYNQALTKISPLSRYCKVVQADDKMYPRCLEEMVDLAEANPSVGVVASHRLVGSEVMPARLPHAKSTLSGREAARIELTEDLSLFGTNTTVMLRADVVRKRHPFFYPEGGLFSDTAAVYEALRDVDFGFVHQILTFTRLDDKSTFGKWQSFHPIALARLIQLQTHGPDFLSREELNKILAAQRKIYGQLIAKEWLLRREPEFWRFHERGLAEIGEKIGYPMLLRGAARVLLGCTSSPGRTAAALLRRLRQYSW